MSHHQWVKALMSERRHYLGFEASSAVAKLVKELMSERRRYLGFEASPAVSKLVEIARDQASSLCQVL